MAWATQPMVRPMAKRARGRPRGGGVARAGADHRVLGVLPEGVGAPADGAADGEEGQRAAGREGDDAGERDEREVDGRLFAEDALGGGGERVGERELF